MSVPISVPISVRYALHENIAVLTLDNPPVNGLGHATRLALVESLARAQADPAVEAIVVAGAGKLFCGGADIREFGSPKALAEPHLLRVIEAAEASAKPVIAAVHGACVGGGLEFALGCHYRVAATGTQVALPEVHLGLVPGAGGTQRLPRAIGVPAALDFIVQGVPVRSEVLAALPQQRLFDRIVEGDLLPGAVDFARAVAALRPLPRLRDRPVVLDDAPRFFESARQRVASAARRLRAPLHCLDCVERAATLDFEAGMAYERETFATLLASAESKALRHLFFAERAASKVADVPEDTPVRRIATVGVVGAGTMGRGIAMSFLAAGLPVTLVDRHADALAESLDAIRALGQSQVGKGKLPAPELERRMAMLKSSVDLEALRDADLVVEAVIEDMATKEAVFRALDALAKPGAILATNTSTLDVDRIAAATRRPADVLGLHFFSPAHVMKLLEIVRARYTAKDVLATALRLGKTLGKTCVVAGVCDGFIGNRMLEQYVRQAGFLLEEGATPAQVDAAAERFGFAMGPFRVADLAGNDISRAIRERRAREKPTVRYSRIADRVCDLGRFGQKTSAGWYDYAAGSREARPSDVVQALIDQERRALGRVARAIADDEIVHRLVYALVNEGARILEEGIAARASDIDLVYVTGYGFPRQHGGPMAYADAQGLADVAAAMERFARNPNDDASFWQPAPTLAALAAAGGRFG